MRAPAITQCLTAALLAAAAYGAPATAQTLGDTQNREALAHARALERAFYTLDRYIRHVATTVTTWTGNTPPPATGWQAGWTARGLRAQYCGGTLIVYFDRAHIKGVGGNHRAVQTAPTAAARGVGGEARPLQWLENGVARGSNGRPTVTPPACMADLPSGRAALAARVRDPWTVIRTVTEWETRDIMLCPAGNHRPHHIQSRDRVGRERRQVTQAVVPGKRDAQTGEPITSGDPTYGDWETMWSHCVADFSRTVTETRPCTFPVPGGAGVPGREIWTGVQTRTADPDNRLLTHTTTSWGEAPTSTTCEGEIGPIDMAGSPAPPDPPATAPPAPLPAPLPAPAEPPRPYEPASGWETETIQTRTKLGPCTDPAFAQGSLQTYTSTRTVTDWHVQWPDPPQGITPFEIYLAHAAEHGFRRIGSTQISAAITVEMDPTVTKSRLRETAWTTYIADPSSPCLEPTRTLTLRSVQFGTYRRPCSRFTPMGRYNGVIVHVVMRKVFDVETELNGEITNRRVEHGPWERVPEQSDSQYSATTIHPDHRNAKFGSCQDASSAVIPHNTYSTHAIATTVSADAVSLVPATTIPVRKKRPRFGRWGNKNKTFQIPAALPVAVVRQSNTTRTGYYGQRIQRRWEVKIILKAPPLTQPTPNPPVQSTTFLIASADLPGDNPAVCPPSRGPQRTQQGILVLPPPPPPGCHL